MQYVGTAVQYDVLQALESSTVLRNTDGCWVSHSDLSLIWIATEMDTVDGYGQSA